MTHVGRVFVIGSCNQDIAVAVDTLPAPGQTVPGNALHVLPGGKGANQAVAAARAGAEVIFVASVGADAAGRHALDVLAAEGVDTSSVRVDQQRPTGTAVVLVAADGENQIVVVAGANATLDADLVRDALASRDIGSSDVALVCFEIGDEAVAAAAAMAAERGARLVVNPSPVRPLTPHVLAAHPVLVTNAIEAALLTGAVGAAAARSLHQIAAGPVLMTLGEAGALLVDDRGEQTFAAIDVVAIDTVGAGDTFAGVLAARLAGGHDLRSAAKYATVGASLSVTRSGARGGMPGIADIEAALQPASSS